MSDIPSRKFRGGCVCRSIRYEVDGPPVIIAHCHCENCQRGSGAGHSTGAMFSSSTLQIIGTATEYVLKSENGNAVTRIFCPVCGSQILGRNSAMDGFVTIGLGTLDDSDGLTPQVAIFARNRKSWDLADPQVTYFEAQPGWKPADGA